MATINQNGTKRQDADQVPDQFGSIVTKARSILRSQTGLIPKAATNTAENTNVMNLDKTIGDLADLVETTVDPVWKETYRIALARCLAASEKASGKVGATPNSADSISAAQQDVVNFNHPLVGIVEGLNVSSYSARQAGYQQRFNPPPPAIPGPFLPLDPAAAGNEYNWLDTPEIGTTAIRTQTNPSGSQLAHGAQSPVGSSNK